MTTRTRRLLTSTALLVAGCSSANGERSAETAAASSHGTSTPPATVMSTSIEPVVNATVPDTTAPDVTESADTSAAPDTTTASTSTTTTTVVDQPSAAGHTVWIETFVDTSRRTEPATGPALDSRILETTIYRPNGEGPFPLIAFAHGFNGHPEKFTKLFSAWADAGLVVVAPAFPLTNSHVPQTVMGDVAAQTDDVRFVIDQVLELAESQHSELHDAIDAGRIGVGGLSLGSAAAYALGFDPADRDARVTAVLILNGLPAGGSMDGHIPLLIADSLSDPVLSYDFAKSSYAAAAAPVWLMTFDFSGHAAQWEDDVTPFDQIAEVTTLDFWNATLKGDDTAYAALENDATVENMSSIESKS